MTETGWTTENAQWETLTPKGKTPRPASFGPRHSRFL